MVGVNRILHGLHEVHRAFAQLGDQIFFLAYTNAVLASTFRRLGQKSEKLLHTNLHVPSSAMARFTSR